MPKVDYCPMAVDCIRMVVHIEVWAWLSIVVDDEAGVREPALAPVQADRIHSRIVRERRRWLFWGH